MTTFFALDVETANRRNQASICQIGIAKYQDGVIVEEFCILINPEDSFSKINISIHGISEEHVKTSPTFPEIFQTIFDFIDNHPIAAHTSFDSKAIQLACAKYDLNPPKNKWIDTALIARRTWEEVSKTGYNLPNLCERLDFDYDAHDALEDAKACAHVLLCAMEDDNLTFAEIMQRGKPGSRSETYNRYPPQVSQEGNTNGEFYGKAMVFTGDLPISRSEAASKAAEAGFTIKGAVSKKVDFLVLGKNGEGTTKHKRALEFLKQGHEIEVIDWLDVFAEKN